MQATRGCLAVIRLSEVDITIILQEFHEIQMTYAIAFFKMRDYMWNGTYRNFVVLMIVVCLVRDGVPACYFSLIENDMRMVVGWMVCERRPREVKKKKAAAVE